VRIQRDAAVDRAKLKFRLILDQPVRILEAPEVMNVGRVVWQVLGFVDDPCAACLPCELLQAWQ